MPVLIVYNEFLQGDIYRKHAQAYADCFQDAILKSNSQLLYETPKNVSSVLFLDKDIFLCKRLEEEGLKVYNSSKAIELCDSKALTYLALKDAKIKIPNTLILPFTYDNVGYPHANFLRGVSYPVVIKESFGSFGEGVFLAENQQAAESIIKRCKKPILQEFIQESFGCDIRVLVCGGTVVAAMKRQNQNGDFRSNIFLGGAAYAHTLSKEMESSAIAAAKALGCDFCGVDILTTGHVLEVNSNPHMQALSRINGISCYEKIANYIEVNKW